MTVRQDDGRGEAPPGANGYWLNIPPGWVRLPLRHGTEHALEELVLSRLKDLPPDIPKDDGMRHRLAVRRTRYGVPLAASFLVSDHVAGESPPLPAEPLLARLAPPTDGARVSTRELAGTPAVRREHVRPAEPERDLHVATRRVEYALPVTHNPRRIISVVFSTPGDGDVGSAFTKALAELFDASMLTFPVDPRRRGLLSGALPDGQD